MPPRFGITALRKNMGACYKYGEQFQGILEVEALSLHTGKSTSVMRPWIYTCIIGI
jgi:hypothetical protein